MAELPCWLEGNGFCNILKVDFLVKNMILVNLSFLVRGTTFWTRETHNHSVSGAERIIFQ